MIVEKLSRPALRVLAAVMDLRAAGERLTRRLGYADGSMGAVTQQLAKLRVVGLVAWEKGKAATLTASCAFGVEKE